MKPAFRRAALAALCALGLSGCIDSAKPILSGSKALLGPQLHLQFFSLRNGFAHDPEQARYVWNGTHYVHTEGGMADISAFSVHPFAVGDYILQSGPPKDGQATEYALLHTLTDGVYQVIPIDEDDADQATRTAHCRHVDKSYCRIETRDELLAFARATATRHRKDGGLVIRLPDVAERQDHKP